MGSKDLEKIVCRVKAKAVCDLLDGKLALAQQLLGARLAEIVEAHGGLWCAEAEKYLLEHAPRG